MSKLSNRRNGSNKSRWRMSIPVILPSGRPANWLAAPESSRCLEALFEDVADNDDNMPLIRGRVKQVARARDPPPAPRPSSAGRQSIPTDRYKPPSPPAGASSRVVVKKRKSVESTSEPVVVEAHAVPISADSGRVMIGQHEISRKFNKNHVAIKPVKEPPLPDMTLSSFWHAVSYLCNNTL